MVEAHGALGLVEEENGTVGVVEEADGFVRVVCANAQPKVNEKAAVAARILCMFTRSTNGRSVRRMRSDLNDLGSSLDVSTEHFRFIIASRSLVTGLRGLCAQATALRADPSMTASAPKPRRRSCLCSWDSPASDQDPNF